MLLKYLRVCEQNVPLFLFSLHHSLISFDEEGSYPLRQKRLNIYRNLNMVRFQFGEQTVISWSEIWAV